MSETRGPTILKNPTIPTIPIIPTIPKKPNDLHHPHQAHHPHGNHDIVWKKTLVFSSRDKKVDDMVNEMYTVFMIAKNVISMILILYHRSFRSKGSTFFNRCYFCSGRKGEKKTDDMVNDTSQSSW